MIVLTDLDRYPCPSALISEWLMNPLHPNLLLRVAVREIEAWLLADRTNIAHYLRTSEKWIPIDPDGMDDPKATLIEAARRSRSRELRERIVPNTGSTAKQGREYNSCLAGFVHMAWDIGKTATQSKSLRRTVLKLESFTPLWPADTIPAQ